MGLTEEEIQERIPLIEEFAGIGDFIYQPVRKYSSGMFARLAFSVAIHVDPDILIVDEALSVGDIFFQTKCYEKFNEFRRAGKTILFVSHDLSSIIRYCDRCLLINKGEQITIGGSKEVVDRYRKILVSRTLNEEQDTGGGEGISPDVPAKLPQDGDWKSRILLNPDMQDYGNHQAEYLDYGVFNEQGEATSMILKGSTFSVAGRFRFNEHIDRPIFTFRIRNQKGEELCGTNTMYERQTLDQAERGLTGVIRFTQKMTLRGGEYLLSISITGLQNGEITAYHRLYDVCYLQVVSQQDKLGVFDMESRVTYEDLRTNGGGND